MGEIILILLKAPFDIASSLMRQLLNEYPSFISVPSIICAILLASKIIALLTKAIERKLVKGNIDGKGNDLP